MTDHARSRRILVPLLLTGALAAGVVTAPVAASAVGTARIAGTIVDADTLDPISGVTVSLYTSISSSVYSATVTDVNGDYELPGLDAGNYRLRFDPPPSSGFQQEWYPSGYSLNTATVFALADGEALTADADLDLSATISGSVVGEDGATGAGLQILLYRFEGDTYTGYATGGTPTWNTATLTYEYSVPPGTYRIRFADQRPASATSYRDMMYDDVFAFDNGTPVVVGPGDTVSLPTVTMSRLGPVTTERLAGANRYDTAVAVSSQFASFNSGAGTYVYLASGENYPDALSAGPAAAARNAPLLLTPRGALPTAVRAELQRLQPETVIIVGGSAVVSDAVAADVGSIVGTVVRIGGVDRYETSRMIVEEAFNGAVAAFIATGRNFPDALAATAAAAKLSAPVVLVNGSSPAIDSATATLLGPAGLVVEDVYIAGGTGVVSEGIAASLADIESVASVTRLGGADRYATSVLINERVFDIDDASDDPDVFVAVGTGFADALAGAALAGSMSAPLFTVRSNCVPTDTLDLFALIEIEKVWLLGGTGVLSTAVRDLVPCP